MGRILLILFILFILGGAGFAAFLAFRKPEPPSGAIEIPVPAEKLSPQ